MARERIAIRLAERRRPSADVAARAHRIHEIAQRQNTADRVGRIALAPRAERIGALGDDFGGQRDVGGDDQISRPDVLDDLPVGDVEAERTCTARKFGMRGIRSGWLATSVTATPVRSAARNKISLTTFGQASASTQMLASGG